MYPMLGTHPDLAYMVVALGRHSVTPRADHQHALECALWYLKAMSDQQLIFQCRTPSGTVLHGFVDADWASDVNDRKSTSGFVFMLGGTAVSWSSKKQTLVTLSSTEAEYIATLHATKEVVWLKTTTQQTRPRYQLTNSPPCRQSVHDRHHTQPRVPRSHQTH